jgi:hypothetical protein
MRGRFGLALDWQNRRIAQTVALSLVLHAILLGTLRVTAPLGEGLNIVPDLLLQIEIEDGTDPEREPPPPMARAAPPPEQLAAEAESLPNAPEPVSELPRDGETEASATSDETLVAQSALSADSAIVTSTGESYRQEPVSGEANQTETAYVAIPSTQQEMLTRRILKGVQNLLTDSSEVRLSWQDGARTYVARVISQPTTDGMDIERATVEIDSEEHGKHLRTRMQMKRLAFSHFTQLVDRWDPDVQLHDDVISGRFHSNSEIMLAYDRKIAPLFLGKVTTAARAFGIGETVGRRRRDFIFPQGLETGAGKIKFPEKLAAAFDQHPGKADVRALSGDTRLTFFSDGTYNRAEPGSEAREYHQMNPDMPTYLVGSPNSTLYVRGTVRGKVLVYSPQRIVIEDDLMYARDPRLSPESNDYLGLVSGQYVEIAAPRVTGPGDIKIHAAVYAKRRFIVTHVEGHKTATLFIYGSLTAGSLSETEPRYATHIEFDPRFERLRPPGFPLTNKYEIETWDAQWQELGDGDRG